MSLRLLCTLLVLLTSFMGCSFFGKDPKQARQLAKNAYANLSTNPFTADSIESAHEDLERAMALGPKEPWVYIALGQLALVRGHDAGNWYNPKTHQADMLLLANQFAAKAVQLGPNEAMAWSFQALTQHLQQQTTEAYASLNKAHELDSNLFQPYLLRAVFLRRTRDYEEAEHWYHMAENHAAQTFEMRQVLREQAVLAHARDLPESELTFLLRQATLEPKNAWSQGLVAEWYMKQAKYAEAVRWWETTVAIAPFARAQNQLARACEGLAGR